MGADRVHGAKVLEGAGLEGDVRRVPNVDVHWRLAVIAQVGRLGIHVASRPAGAEPGPVLEPNILPTGCDQSRLA